MNRESSYASQCNFGLIITANREGTVYRIIGTRNSMETFARQLLSRLNGKEPCPWKDSNDVMICEKLVKPSDKRSAVFTMEVTNDISSELKKHESILLNPLFRQMVFSLLLILATVGLLFLITLLPRP